MRKPRILVVGSLVMDLIVSTAVFPKSGETVLGLDYRTAPGGKGANQAVQAARLGAEVTMVGRVGNDAFGAQLLESARASKVNVAHVALSSTAPTAVGNVQLEMKDGQNSNRIIVVSGANMEIKPEDVEFLRTQIDQYDLVMLQMEIPLAINELVAQIAAEKGVPVMLNCAPFAPLPQTLLKNLTYISPNEHEARMMTGITVATEDDIHSALQKIREMGVKNALITLGDRGVAYEDENGRFSFSPALKNLPVLDTTAAGDSFVGAFCTAICLKVSMGDALRFANCAAALTVCRMGAQPSLPTIQEVLAFMEKNNERTEAFRALAEE